MFWLVAQLLLVGAVPDLPGPGPGDEAFAIGNPGQATIDLAGWSVTDGEGTWVVPPDSGLRIRAGDVAWVVGNVTTWTKFQGETPVAVWSDSKLKLANDGDELQLISPQGVEVDAMAWGEDHGLHPRAGDVLIRQRDTQGTWADTDDSEDWRGPIVHRVGQSNLPSRTFPVSAIRPYASPDDAHAVLVELLSQARQRVVLHVYDLDETLASPLEAAARRGVPVDILATKVVVGDSLQERSERDALLQRLMDAGAQAVVANKGRYAFHHLKVLVADDVVAVQSENWVQRGVPPAAHAGNRGWGLAVHDSAMADWFAGWMADDRVAWDIEAPEGSSPAPRPVQAQAASDYRSQPGTWLTGDFHVTPVICPEHCFDGAYLEPLRAAQSRAWSQQMDTEVVASNRLGWSGPDVLLDAFRQAVRGGAEVRVQVSAYGEEAVNELVAAGVNVQLWNHPFLGTLHNKGIIADDAVLVGSMNGNQHSRSANREVALWVSGPGAADHHARLFASDWHQGRDWTIVADDLGALAPAAPLAALAGVLLALAGTSRRRAAECTSS